MQLATTASRARTWWHHAVHSATDLLFPPTCLLCDLDTLPGSDRHSLCAGCTDQLARPPGPTCPRCAMPCPELDAAAGPCPQCKGLKLQFHAARTLGQHDGLIRQCVHRTKHAYHEPLATALGHLLAARIRANPFPAEPELIAPVPMFWLKRLFRGTSAAESLAQALGRALGLPVASSLLVCRRYLQHQSHLLPDERRRNVRRAYRLAWRYRIAGAKILLVDDVVTTGATAHEAARVLRQAGAAAVYVAAIARGTGDF